MIFNKNNTGSAEIKGMIGWIYKANSYTNLESYLRIAKRDIIRLIGKEVYAQALTHYKSSDYEKQSPSAAELLLDELVHSIQLPMALLAYRKYAPGVDVQHSESGRQIIVTAELKPAFEWQIERDNRNITSLYHESLDILLEFLDEQLLSDPANSISGTWGGSEAYKTLKSLFITSLSDFEQAYPLNNSRRLFISMIPFIREVENSHIKSAVTPVRYDAIIEKNRDKYLTEEDKKILELSRIPIALFTMSIALKRLTVEVLPDAIVQNFNAMDARQSHTAKSEDRLGLSALLEREGRKYLIPLHKYIASLNQVVEEEEIIDTTKPFFMA